VKSAGCRFVAQSEPLCGHPWVRCWLHPEHLDLRGVKMSKSLGNVIGIPDLLARHGADGVRWFYATHHYRSKLPFGWDLLDQAVTGYQRIKRLVDVLAERLLAANDALAIPARGDYASQRPDASRVPRLRHTYTYGAYGQASERFLDRFVAAMDDDLNVPSAMAALFDYVGDLYAAGADSSADAASQRTVK
jgi:cysteinyl-tRNA synthetase